MSIVEELESSIDIVELVSRYVTLKKAGVNYKALCPFPGHNEKTPSFMVSPTKQLAYCFWCHRWWGPVKFVMDIENCEFREAIEILSNITWVKLKWFDAKVEKQKKNLYSLYKDASKYYSESLKKYPKILEYLENRWITEQSIRDFSIWFSDSGIELYNYLKGKWYTDEQIEESTIFLNVKQKKDKFINRIIFPIKNNRWDIVAFTWRIVWAWEPKYLNSPASKFYDKSAILYWLFEAKRAIAKQDFVIVCEGQVDVISLHRAWFNNSVAISGTALTEKHLKIIKRLTHKIYLCFDNDWAWEKATKLSLDLLKNKWFELKIIDLGKYWDPDELIISWWDFKENIKEALTPIWYYIKKSKFDLNSIDEKKKLLEILLNILKNYSDKIVVDFYLKEISKKLDISLELVYLEYNKTKIKRNFSNEENIIKKKNIFFTEDYIIAYILNDFSFLEILDKKLILKEEIWENIKKIFEFKEKFLDKIQLQEKEKFRALSFKIAQELEYETWEKKLQNFEKLIDKYNKDLLKQKEKILKDKIKLWDSNAFLEYNELQKILKKV